MTELELWNMALAHVGQPPVDDTAGTTESHIACSAFYVPTRQLFLKQSKLHLARKEVSLALATGESSVRYEFVYGQPADLLHPLEIWAGSSSAAPIKYEIETHSNLNSSVIKTDESEPVLIYVIDIPLMNRYPVDDVIAMSYLLASFITMPLKNDLQLEARMQEKYAIALSVSIANDQNMQSVEIVNNERYSSIADARL